jgi:hypothetical protein
VPWVNKQFVSSDFTYRTRKKAEGKILKLRGHLNAFWCQLQKNSGVNGNLGDGLAKDKLCPDMFGLLSPKTTLNHAKAL